MNLNSHLTIDCNDVSIFITVKIYTTVYIIHWFDHDIVEMK